MLQHLNFLFIFLLRLRREVNMPISIRRNRWLLFKVWDILEFWASADTVWKNRSHILKSFPARLCICFWTPSIDGTWLIHCAEPTLKLANADTDADVSSWNCVGNICIKYDTWSLLHKHFCIPLNWCYIAF